MAASPALSATLSATWTFIDGGWHEGNVLLWGARTHAIWLGSSVFDGARVFEGVAPDLDLHCARVNASAKTMYLKPTMTAEEIEGLTREGMKKLLEFETDRIEIRKVRPRISA